MPTGNESVIIVDISPKLTLFNVDFRDEIKITSLKIVELTKDRQDEIVLNSLRQFIAENNITHKNVILRPSLNSLLIKRIQILAVPDRELSEAIKWHIKEDVTYDLSRVVLDYSVIKKTTREDGSKIFDIICALAKEEEISRWVLLLKQLGLRCLLVGILPFGYEKIIETYLAQEKNKTLGVLHLSEDIGYFAIYKNSKLEFYRVLPVSINNLKESLRSVLVSDKGRIELSDQEANEVLFKVGIPQDNAVSYRDKLDAGQIISMLRSVLERLAVEIKRSLAYYDSQFKGGRIDKILICGSAVKINNIEKFLNKELSLNTEKIYLKDKITVSPRIDSQVFAQNYAAFGLALDYKQTINLLPREFRSEKIEMLQRMSLRWFAFIVFLIFGVSFIFANLGIRSYRARLDNAKLQLNVLSEVKLLKSKIDGLNSFIADVKDSQLPIAQILNKLSYITPKELLLSEFSLDCDSKTGTITGFVKGSDNNPDAVLNKFITDIEDSLYFIDVNIVSVEKSSKENAEVVDFHIDFKLP
ncbi:MAG: pilus assembly protein PilM [Candidatus Omnitrophica bacterium]|nr:pilus assembly protein PilM [Candidatus Omnitrophota bacterium]MDD5352145.1 pilus assembly protein PilM [Candidatus Omnitrophota bacterium]MDD5549743.1 pilus assembly protein PilM [Candidatus Omnitrophota bacterium]